MLNGNVQDNVYIESLTALNVGTLVSQTGNIQLTIPDSDNTENLGLASTSSISAGGNVLLQVGSNVNLAAGSSITAEGGGALADLLGTITIAGDFDSGVSSSPDAATTFNLFGLLKAKSALVTGADDKDIFNAGSVYDATPLTITSTGADNTYNVSSDAGVNQGTLANIQDTLTINAGTGTDNRLIISDYGNTTTAKTNVLQTTATIGGATYEQIQNFAGIGSGPVINYRASGSFNNVVAGVDLADGILLIGSHTLGTIISFLSTLTGSSIFFQGGNGNDSVNVGATPGNAVAGFLTNINFGELTVNEGTGTANRLVISDYANTTTAKTNVIQTLETIGGTIYQQIQDFAGNGSGPDINYTAAGSFSDVVSGVDKVDGVLLIGSHTLGTAISFLSTLSGSTTFFQGGNGADSVSVGCVPGNTSAGNLANVNGELTINEGTGNVNRLIISDYADTTTAKTNVIQTTASIAGTPYEQIQNFAGGGNGPVINYTAAGSFNNVAEGGANLADGILLIGSHTLGTIISFLSTLAGSTTFFQGGNGNDFVSVGATPGNANTGNLANIKGELTVNEGTGTANRLIISDEANTTTAKTSVVQTLATIGGTAYQQIQDFAASGSGPSINYTAAGGFNDVVGGSQLQDGVLLAGSNTLSSTFNVQTTLAGSTTKITGGSGPNYFVVSSAANLTGIPAVGLTPNGTLNGIAGNLTINAGSSASNRLIVSDFGQTTTAKTNVIQTAAVIGGVIYQQLQNFAGNGNGPTINYVASGGGFNDVVGGANLQDGILLAGSNTLSSTFNVQTTLAGSTTKITGGSGPNYFVVSSVANLAGVPAVGLTPNGTLNGIVGNLMINAGSSASNRLIVSDFGQTTTAKANVIQTAAVIGGVTYQQVQNFAGNGNGPTINYVASGGGFNDVVGGADFQDGVLLAGSNTLSNTFNVQTTLAGSTTKITGGSGPNYFVVSSSANVTGIPTTGLTPNGTLNGIAGNLTIDAGSSASNRLIVSDFGQTITAKANVIQTAAVIGGVTYQQLQNFAGNGNGPTINYVASGGGFNHVVGGANLRDGVSLAGSNTLSSTFNVQTTLAGSTTKITGGSGPNYFVVSSAANVTGVPAAGLTPNGTLNGIAGNLTINAGSSASNRLIVSDFGQTATAKTNVIQTAVVIGGVT